MNRKVRETIKEYSMLADSTGVVVGFSGGADSVALLHFLNGYCKELVTKVYAAHVNHMLRGECSERDEAFVREFCKQYGIPLYVLRFDVAAEAEKCKIGLEECGREVRYRFFEEILEKTGSQKIATAHTLSDNAETLLYHITRGSGLKGIRGILPVRDNIIRPLLFVTRKEVEEYCSQNNLSFVTDDSNFDSRYARNKIRHEVIPKLREINPEFEESTARLTKSLAEDYEFIEGFANQVLEKAKGKNGSLVLPILSEYHSAIIKRCLREHLFSYFGIEIDSKKLNSLYNLIKNGKTSNKLQLKGNFYAIISYNCVLFREITKKQPEFFCLPVKMGITIAPNGKIIELTEKFNNLDNKMLLDYAKIKGNIFVRTRKEGDRFAKVNGSGSKSLKRLLIDEKIPAEKRGELLVFTDDEEIIFIEGLGASKSKAAGKSSENIITINITGGNTNA